MKNTYKSKIKKLKETGFFHIFILNIFNKAVGFIGNLIVIRILSKAEYGIYSSAFNYLSIVLITSGLGMVSGSFQLCSEFSSDQENHSKIYRYSSTFGFWFDCFLTVFLILSAIWGRFSFAGAKRYLLFLALEPPLRIIYNFQMIYLRSKLMNREFAITTSINSFSI